MRRPLILRLLSFLMVIFWPIAGLSVAFLSDHQAFAAQRQERRLGSLLVRVVDRSRNPVEAIVVIQGGSSWAGRTNFMGYYSVSVPPGKYVVSALYRGHSAAQRVSVDAGRAKRITIAFRVADSNTPPAASGASNRSGQRPAASATPPSGAAATGRTQSGSAQRPVPSSKPAPGTTPGTASTPAPAPESAPETAQTPTPTKPTPPGKPAKLNALTADPPVTEPGGTSRITAEVVNPDSVPLTFSWIASGGSISGAEAQALWVAPQSTGEFTISVVVKDSKGRTASGSIGVYVQAPSSSKPAPTPTPAPAPLQITALTADPTVTPPGGTSSITAEVANPDNLLLTFSWVASGGSISGAEAQALWVAPQSTGAFTISVVVKDSIGRTASGSIGVDVQASSPAPAPTPAPTDTRDPALWPFDPLSFFNHPIGSGAVFVTPQVATESSFVFGGSVHMDVARWSKNVWIAVSSDPVRSLLDYAGTVQFQVRVPNNAVAAGGTDGDIVFIDEAHAFSYEAGQVSKLANGNWQAVGIGQRWYKHDLKGLGYVSSFQSCDAWGQPGYGGLIRRGELDNGIFHAMQVSIPKAALNGGSDGAQRSAFVNGVAVGPGFVWPANSRDRLLYGTNGNLYLGTLLAIPGTVDITKLGITHPWALTMARAMQDYGIYLTHVQNSINGVTSFKADGAAADYFVLPAHSTPEHPFWQGLNTALRQLKVVSNNLPTSIGGGGTPRQPPAPPLRSRAQALVEGPLRPLQLPRRHS